WFNDVVGIASVVGVIVVFTHGLGANRTGLPRRNILQLRSLPIRLLAGFGVGLFVGAPLSWHVYYGSGVYESSWQEPALLAAMIGALLGIPWGLASWLSSPAAPHDRVSPGLVLRRDGRALLITAGAAGAAACGVTMLMSPAGIPPVIGISAG